MSDMTNLTPTMTPQRSVIQAQQNLTPTRSVLQVAPEIKSPVVLNEVLVTEEVSDNSFAKPAPKVEDTNKNSNM